MLSFFAIITIVSIITFNYPCHWNHYYDHNFGYQYYQLYYRNFSYYQIVNFRYYQLTLMLQLPFLS